MSHHDGDGPAGLRGGDPAREPRRSPEERRADHAAIDRLADELLPALVAKLGASGLGELDVHEGAWRVRLRMPGDARAARRALPGGRPSGRAETHASPPGHGAAGIAPVAGIHGQVAQPGDPAPLDEPAASPTRAVATSPAVGFFRPRADLPAGARVRAGDRLGAIDVLGVPQEVVAPADGLVGASLVEPGEPVEYGQDVIEIELLGAPAAPRAEAG